VGGELAQVLHRILVHDQGLLEVEDMDAIAVTVDVRGHPRIPEPRLVAEMDSGLEHLPHGDGHDRLRLRVGTDTPLGRGTLPARPETLAASVLHFACMASTTRPRHPSGAARAILADLRQPSL